MSNSTTKKSQSKLEPSKSLALNTAIKAVTSLHSLTCECFVCKLFSVVSHDSLSNDVTKRAFSFSTPLSRVFAIISHLPINFYNDHFEISNYLYEVINQQNDWFAPKFIFFSKSHTFKGERSLIYSWKEFSKQRHKFNHQLINQSLNPIKRSQSY